MTEQPNPSAGPPAPQPPPRRRWPIIATVALAAALTGAAASHALSQGGFGHGPWGGHGFMGGAGFAPASLGSTRGSARFSVASRSGGLSTGLFGPNFGSPR